MKSDARYLINKKKWKKKVESRDNSFKLDARKIINYKKTQHAKKPVLGSFMRTQSATALIASQIKREITAASKVPDKRIKIAKDGNIIVTSKTNPRNIPQVVQRNDLAPKFNIGVLSRNRSVENNMQNKPSTSMEEDDLDLEHTAIEDVLDLDSLPQSYFAPKSLQSTNLSRSSVMSQILDKKHTMVADQLSEHNTQNCSKVYVSNLHPSVSRQDVMELFGDIGAIKGVTMVMPGTSVIEFFNEEDAKRACTIYDNRLLDGLPMKCVCVNSSSTRQRLGPRQETDFPSTSTSLSPIVFNPRTRYNPRNVQFTVKLT